MNIRTQLPPQNYVRTSKVNTRQYSTIDVTQIVHGPLTTGTRANNPRPEMYQFYASARPHVLQKENIPTNQEVSKSATQSSANFNKDELISRIKKLNQIRQKSQQNVQPLSKKKPVIQEENGSHQRNRSTTQQMKSNNVSTSHQLLQKTQNFQHPIAQRYANNQDIIYEEQSPFIEGKSMISREYTKQKQDTSVLSNPSQSRSRIKETLFQQADVNQKSHRNSSLRPSEYLSKISNIASHVQQEPQKYNDKSLSAYFNTNCNSRERSQTNQPLYVEMKKSIENMCKISQQQLNNLQEIKHEIKQDLCPPKRAMQPRCVSADMVQIKPKFQETAQKNDRQQKLTEPPRFDLSCDEEVKVDQVETANQNIISQPIIERDNSTEDSPGSYSQETLKFLVLREKEYAPDPHYLNNTQSQITWQMRAILIDWMMEVSSEFHLKKETFYLALCYVDRYLSKADSISKQRFQLVGLTAMFMACKIEEIYPRKVSDFARAADFGYPCEVILEMELKMVAVLRWMINPPTMNLWLNWYMGQWDLFVEKQPFGRGLKFKNPSEDSFQIYCQLSQLIDCCVLEIQYLQYPTRTLIAAFMYLTLSVAEGVFAKGDIMNIRHTSLFLLDQTNQFNHYFGGFVQFSFGFQLIDLLPAIQFGSTFFDLIIGYDSPPGVQTLAGTSLEGHYEEFLSFQMHNKQALQFVKQRPRHEI